MRKLDINIEKCNSPEIFLDRMEEFLNNRQKAPVTYLDEVESFLDNRCNFLHNMLTNIEEIVK